MVETLFSTYDLSTVLENQQNLVDKEILEIPENQFMRLTEQELIDHLKSEYEIVPLTIYEDQKDMEDKEVQVDVSNDFGRDVRNRSCPFYVKGIQINIMIPYSGDSNLWRCKPNIFDFNPPHATMDEKNSRIILSFMYPNDEIAIKKKVLDGLSDRLKSINKYISWINDNVNQFNAGLESKIKYLFLNRCEQINKKRDLIKSLNIPLKQKDNVPDLNIIPINKRIIKPLPSVPNSPPEAAISDGDYELILKVIRHEGRTFETTPKTYRKHDEEELRNIILAHLNGHFQGDATGETFRGKGKTDIRIEDDNRAAFVAECKIWGGKAILKEAINQLLGYLTWRDSKCSIILFNFKNSQFMKIQSGISEIFKEHEKYLSVIPSEAGEWRFRFKSLDDDDRIVIIHVFLFNLFTKD